MLTDETHPRQESAVTLLDASCVQPLTQLDTPSVDPPDLPSHPDDVRPWDGLDSDEEYGR